MPGNTFKCRQYQIIAYVDSLVIVKVSGGISHVYLKNLITVLR